MFLLTLDGGESNGGQQKFSKAHGSMPGCSSCEVLINCRRAMGHNLSYHRLWNLCQYDLHDKQPPDIHRTHTAESSLYVVVLLMLNVRIFNSVILTLVGSFAFTYNAILRTFVS